MGMACILRASLITRSLKTQSLIIPNKVSISVVCGAQDNIIYYNIFKVSSECNACYDGKDHRNQWDNGSAGNYWDEYREKYPDAVEIDVIWDTPYNISGGTNQNNYPLVNPVNI